MNFGNLIAESLVVGIVIAVLFVLITNFIIPNSVPKIILIGFIVGFVGYFFFSLLGLSTWYCRNRLNQN